MNRSAIGAAICWAFSACGEGGGGLVAPETTSLSLRLVDEAGAPAECAARIWPAGQAEALQEATCGPDGALRWEGIRGGTWWLTWEGPALVRHTQALEVDFVQGLDLGDVVAAPGGGALVQVSQDGEPAAGAQLEILIGEDVTAAETGPDGTWSAESLPVGAIGVRAKRGEWAAGDAVSIDPGSTAVLELALRAPHLRPVAGLQFKTVEDGAQILWIHPQGPAAGLLADGDVILAAGDQPLAGLRQSEAGPLLVVAAGEPIVYRIRRDGRERDVTLTPITFGDLREREDAAREEAP